MPKSYTANDIARYFLAKQEPDAGDLISHLKLQKLCYYAQGVGLAARGEPVFKERLEAWLHGPVVPDLYQAYKAYGDNPIPPVTDLDLDQFDPADRMVLDDVYTYYGQFSGWRLRQMTHAETPWKDAYERDMNHEIAISALLAHFADEVEAGYREKYGEISRGNAH
jgi:uncharacterized phage-associated protein